MIQQIINDNKGINGQIFYLRNAGGKVSCYCYIKTFAKNNWAIVSSSLTTWEILDDSKNKYRKIIDKIMVHFYPYLTKKGVDRYNKKKKEISKKMDRLVTLAKKGTLASRRQAAQTVRFLDAGDDKNAVQKLFSDIAPRFKERNGGYTRVLKLGPRRGDSTPMAIIEFVE